MEVMETIPFTFESKYRNKLRRTVLFIAYFGYFFFAAHYVSIPIQGVSEIRVLILTSERTRQFMKLFSVIFCKLRKSIPRFFAPQFLPNESFCVIN
jgi:hypothetical protein